MMRAPFKITFRLTAREKERFEKLQRHLRMMGKSDLIHYALDVLAEKHREGIPSDDGVPFKVTIRHPPIWCDCPTSCRTSDTSGEVGQRSTSDKRRRPAGKGKAVPDGK